jgi:beta-glucosidase-like glycosyl hydrolase
MLVRALVRLAQVALLVACVLGAAAAEEKPAVYKEAHAPLVARVDDLLARLSLKEKVSLMSGGTTFATAGVERLGLPSLNFSDGPNGVRVNEGTPTTVFPTGSALAATWNPTVLRQVGEAIGREAKALNIKVMLGPNVNIQRSPLAGRNFEAYSEDGAFEEKSKNLREIRSPESHKAAVDAAREAIVLLKNSNNLLPLDRSKIKTLAVIGPNADVPLYEGGGSAGVIPGSHDTPLEALRHALGQNVKINYVAGADNDALLYWRLTPTRLLF